MIVFRWKMEPILPWNTMMKLGWAWVKSTTLKSYSHFHGHWRNSSPKIHRTEIPRHFPRNFAPRTCLQNPPTSPNKSPTFQSQICPSTSKFAHHFTKVVRYFLIHGSFETTICLLHLGCSGLQSLKKGEPVSRLKAVWNCGRKELYDSKTLLHIVYLHSIYIYTIKSFYIILQVNHQNRNMKLFYKVLYHDGLWSLSSIGKEYLAVEMVSIMVHLTSAKLLIWGLLEHWTSNLTHHLTMAWFWEKTTKMLNKFSEACFCWTCRIRVEQVCWWVMDGWCFTMDHD